MFDARSVPCFKQGQWIEVDNPVSAFVVEDGEEVDDDLVEEQMYNFGNHEFRIEVDGDAPSLWVEQRTGTFPEYKINICFGSEIDLVCAWNVADMMDLLARWEPAMRLLTGKDSAIETSVVKR